MNATPNRRSCSGHFARISLNTKRHAESIVEIVSVAVDGGLSGAREPTPFRLPAENLNHGDRRRKAGRLPSWEGKTVDCAGSENAV